MPVEVEVQVEVFRGLDTVGWVHLFGLYSYIRQERAEKAKKGLGS